MFVDLHLLGRVHAADRIEDLAFHVGDRGLHALAAVPRRVVVAQLHRLVRAGRGAGRHRGAAHGAAVQHDIDLDRGIAAAVEDLAGDDIGDGGHGRVSFRYGRPRAGHPVATLCCNGWPGQARPFAHRPDAP